MLTTIRDADEADLAALLAIFNEVVRTSTAIFLEEDQTMDERREWWNARVAGGFPVLVAEVEGEVVGFATYGPFHPRSGYRFTVEHTVLIDGRHRGAGLGRALMEALIERARAAGMRSMVGLIDGANTGSIGLHERLGFAVKGRLDDVAVKHGEWLDLVYVQLRLDAP